MRWFSPLESRRVLMAAALAALALLAAGIACSRAELLALVLTPTHTATLTPTVTASPTESATPTVPTPTGTPLPPTETLTPSASPSPTDTVTPGPSLTPSRTPTFTRTPTLTRVPTRTRKPTNTPTITYTPTPPPLALRIRRPGLFSRLTSPFRMEALVRPDGDGWIRIELVGEDERILASQRLDYRNVLGRRFWVYPLIHFKIPGAAETARLRVYTRDLFGRLVSLTSVDLVLLAVGENEINPALLYWEPYLVRFPFPDQVVAGGTVLVVGLARPVNQTPVIFELIDEAGRVVGSAQVKVPEPTGDLSHTPYLVSIPYSVQALTPVRLTIYQESDQRIPGMVVLTSFLLNLAP